jgi:hypothetical protein
MLIVIILITNTVVPVLLIQHKLQALEIEKEVIMLMVQFGPQHGPLFATHFQTSDTFLVIVTVYAARTLYLTCMSLTLRLARTDFPSSVRDAVIQYY